MLRQRFWANYLKQYDTDDTSSFSHLEITAMLDSLSSTLSRETINSWFARFNKASTAELTTSEVIQCLEEETTLPLSQKKRFSSQDESISGAPSGFATPSLQMSTKAEPLNLEKIDFSGPDFQRSPDKANFPDTQPGQPSGNVEVVGQMPVPAGPHLSNKKGNPPTSADVPDIVTTSYDPVSQQQSTSSEEDDSPGSQSSEDNVERVINIKTCPLCHKPRLGAKGELDIITHLAVCASQDWEKVDRITVGNFVTASQAQRKWYTKAIAKLSTGAYSIGAVRIWRVGIFSLLNHDPRTLPMSLFKTVSPVN
jgi:phosphatidylserine decarboxylase